MTMNTCTFCEVSPQVDPPNHDEQIAVVDNENRFVRWESRRVVHEQRLLHRSVYVLVFDSQGRMLIQQRHGDKQTYPRHWDISVAGHVDADDYTLQAGLLRTPVDLSGMDTAGALDWAYWNAARRELSEELGIRTSAIVDVGHYGPDLYARNYEHTRLFTAHWNGSVIPQSSEVISTSKLGAYELETFMSNGNMLITPALFHFGAMAIAEKWVR